MKGTEALTPLEACKQTLAMLESALTHDDPAASTQMEWDSEPLALLRQTIAEHEPKQEDEPALGPRKWKAQITARSYHVAVAEVAATTEDEAIAALEELIDSGEVEFEEDVDTWERLEFTAEPVAEDPAHA